MRLKLGRGLVTGSVAHRAYLTTFSSQSRSTTLLDELQGRGLVAASTSQHLSRHLASPTGVYAGVDPSASSLHVGNLLPLMGLLHFSLAGHNSFALIGGATGSIGDPSGRSTERRALSQNELNHNVVLITKQVEKIFESAMEYAARRRIGSSGSRSKAVMVVNNLDWTGPVKLIDFLRDVGKYARVNVMLQRDSVRNRLDSESGISFTEFSYQLLQAYDFAHLHRQHGITVQLGGSDQWGNIVAGIDLIRRMRAGSDRLGDKGKEGSAGGEDMVEEKLPEAYGLTMPLLTTSSGEKFGKSAGNAVWLDSAKTSVSDFYQFFYRAADADVQKYLGALTCLPLTTIKDIVQEHKKGPKARTAQKILAEEVTELVHGRAAVTKAQTIATALYSTSLRSLRAADVLAAFEGDTTGQGQAAGNGRFVRIKRSEVKDVPVSKLAVVHGLCKSRSEASKIISSKGIYVNDLPVEDPRREIGISDLIDNHVVILRRGTRDAVVFYFE